MIIMIIMIIMMTMMMISPDTKKRPQKRPKRL